MIFPNLQRERWQDEKNNPIVGYFYGEKNRYAIGDPQVVTPEEFDGKWHMFYHGFFDEGVPYFYHVISDDGLTWEFKARWQFNVGPTYMFRDKERWILYTSTVIYRDMRAQGRAEDTYGERVSYIIQARTSENFEEWSEPTDVILVDLPWERVGPEFCVRNPCMVRLPNGRYRLYYSGGSLNLDICNYPEPLHIGYAESDDPISGFVKRSEPILSPDLDNPYRNLGCGGFKVYGWEGKFLALYNPIYKDEEGMPRSAIAVMVSDDGVDWKEAPYGPIFLPGTAEWKKALVYQLDIATVGDELRIYYNARDEWLEGIERIGMSSLKDASISIHKLI